MDTQKFNGVLTFSGSWLDRPWLLKQDDGTEIDLYVLIDEALHRWNGMPAKQYMDSKSYCLALDASSKYRVKYDPDVTAFLEKREGIGFDNIAAFLPEILTWLSGRKVKVAFNTCDFKIAADKSEEVFGVKFLSSGNSCRIPTAAEHSVCKVNTSECCIFVVASPRGFTCEKFSSLGEQLLHLRFKGTMRASRVGSCALVGREKEAVNEG